MLSELHIKNIAIIEELMVEFSEGFNVLTGETGAGKSIIIEALGLCLGEKFSSQDMRTGSGEGSVEAAFRLLSDAEALKTAREQGINVEEGELFIRRVFSETGRSRAYINGSPAAISSLKSLGNSLLDIHGQHQHQQLLHQEHHLEILDAYGGLLKLRSQVEEGYARLHEIQRKLEGLRSTERDRFRLQDLLNHQVREIEAARLAPGEDEELERELRLIQHAEKLYESASMAYSILYEAEGSASELVARALSHVEDIAMLDPQMSEALKEGKASLYQLQDVAEHLRSYRDKITFDSTRLAQVEERLQQIKDLKKKYGPSIQDILDFREKAFGQLNDLENSSEEIAKLEGLAAELQRELSSQALHLSNKREKAARRLESEAASELSQLSMEGALLRISLERTPDEEGFIQHQGRKVLLSPWGIDKVEFLFSPNPGEGAKPLSVIASGGELSRVMLALKSILAEADRTPTLIFDEVDAGIGGQVAEVVGKKLKAVAEKRQVFCITHLPQIAAMAAHHYRVEKVVSSGRNVTTIRKLSPQERLEEIARMSGGEHISKATLAHAKELLKNR